MSTPCGPTFCNRPCPRCEARMRQRSAQIRAQRTRQIDRMMRTPGGAK